MVDVLQTEQTLEGGTRARELALQLERLILSGEFRPGDRLDEASLARRFQVSRTPVREALKQLSAGGLVETRPRQGAVVTRLTIQDLIYMFELMAVLEGACAGFAARRYAEADRRAISAAHEACLEATRREDPEAFYRANNRFHDAIYVASHNVFIRDQTVALGRRLEPYRHQITFHPGRMSLSNDEHERIMGAIFDMNQPEADRLMRSHLDTLSDDLTSLIDAVNGRRVGD